MNVLSIQSRVAYGCVGNAGAAFALQRLGHEAWTIDTVAFSNHLGHPTWRGRARPAAEVRELVEGLAALGVLERCDAVLSGYLGAAGTGAAVLDAVARVRAANPRALYCCDPVMGERGRGLYVRPGVAEVLAEGLVPAADIVMPNAFELETLSGGSTDTLDAALAAADRLRRGGGKRLVVATGLRRRDGPADTIEALAVDADGAWLAGTKRLEVAAAGAGDVFAALFLGHYLRGRDVEAALSRAVSAIQAVFEATAAAGADELQLVAAQDRLQPADPPVRAVRVR